jgi:hypothetical protein
MNFLGTTYAILLLLALAPSSMGNELATLLKSTKFDIVINGSRAGEITAAVGTKVTVLKEDKDKVLVSLNTSSNWVERADLDIPKNKTLVTPIVQITPSPTPNPSPTIIDIERKTDPVIQAPNLNSKNSPTGESPSTEKINTDAVTRRNEKRLNQEGFSAEEFYRLQNQVEELHATDALNKMINSVTIPSYSVNGTIINAIDYLTKEVNSLNTNNKKFILAPSSDITSSSNLVNIELKNATIIDIINKISLAGNLKVEVSQYAVSLLTSDHIARGSGLRVSKEYYLKPNVSIDDLKRLLLKSGIKLESKSSVLYSYRLKYPSHRVIALTSTAEMKELDKLLTGFLVTECPPTFIPITGTSLDTCPRTMVPLVTQRN